MAKYRYLNCCVAMAPADVPALSRMIADARDVTRRTFLQHVDRDEQRDLEAQLGYVGHPKQGLTMAGDWHVSYHRSEWKGERCYFFRWSHIEHYFVRED